MPILRLLLVVMAMVPLASHAAVAPSAGRVVDVARRQLEARAAGMPGDWEFVVAGKPADMPVEDADARLEADSPEGRWPRGWVGVPVRLWADGRPVRTQVVWFHVRRWMEVPVYARDARAGEMLERVSVQAQRLDMAGISGEPLRSAAGDEVDGLQLVRSVRAGRPVLHGDLRQAADVSRFQEVGLTVRRGAVVLSTRAVAQEDGVMGEPVRVLPDGATEWVMARVSGRKEVVIEE